MNISELLKQFKSIQPDPHYSEKSKRVILAAPQTASPKTGGIFMFLHALETGAALVIVGFFILLVSGSFSGTSYLAPVQYSVIDPAGLHAEADAIDMQIQLANVTYIEVSSTAAESTTPATVSPVIALRSLIAKATTTSTSTTSTVMTDEGSSTSSSSVSIDEALQKLSQ